MLETKTDFLNRFKISDKIGEGSFSDVYKAEQLSTGQLVAIKIFKLTDGTDKEKITRSFKSETDSCALLSHPYLIRLIDRHETEDELFAVYEYHTGGTLRNLLREHGVLSSQLCQLFLQQLLEALVYLEQMEMVHRDFSPKNILANHAFGNTFIKVLDFGISIKQEAVTSLPENNSTDMVLLGTPQYSAPEQLKGGTCTTKSDLFSWGLILLECLTGQPVIEQTSIAEIYNRHASSNHILDDLSVSLHPSLYELLYGVLDKNITHRSSASLALEAFKNLETADFILQEQNASISPIGPDQTLLNDLSWNYRVGEKKPITVLSFQLGISRSLKGNPELLDHTLDRQVGLLLAISEKFGCSTIQHTGNRAVLFFGYPEVKDTDALRAMRTAHAFFAQVTEANLELENLTLDLKIGIHSGVHVHFQSIVPGGLVTAEALDLLETASKDEILVSSSSYTLLSSSFAFDKELDKNGQLFYALSMDKYKTSDSSAVSLIYKQSKLIGRQQEWEHLISYTESGTTPLIIEGTAGIGKSKLLAEFKTTLEQQNKKVLISRCYEERSANTLQPFLEFIRQVISWESLSSMEDKKTELKVFLEDVPNLPPTFGWLLYSWFNLPVEEEQLPTILNFNEHRALLFDGLALVIQKIASNHLLILENIHWLDATGVTFLAHLSNLKTPLVCSARITPKGLVSCTEVVPIPLLNKEEQAKFIYAKLGNKQLTEQALAYVLNKTAGIPLFLEEMIQLLLESGGLQFGKQMYRLNPTLLKNTLPITLKGVLGARIEQVGMAKEMVQLCAVLGSTIDYNLLLACSSKSKMELDQELEILESLEILISDTERQTYTFRHALIKDAAYESIPIEEAKKIHLKVVNELVDSESSEVINNPLEIANHYAKAHRFEQAVHHGNLFLKQLNDLSAFADTIAYATMIANWNTEIKDKNIAEQLEFTWNECMEAAYTNVGGLGDAKALACVQKNTVIAERQNLYQDRLKMAFHQYEATFFKGELRNAVGIAGEEIEKAKLSNDCVAQLWFLPQRAHALHWMGEVTSAKTACQEAINLYSSNKNVSGKRPYLINPACQSYHILGEIHLFEGNFKHAFEAYDKGIIIAKQLNDPISKQAVFLFKLIAYFYLGDKEKVQQEFVTEYPNFQELLEQDLWLVKLSFLVFCWSNDQKEPIAQAIDQLIAIERGAAVQMLDFMVIDLNIKNGDLNEAHKRLSITRQRLVAYEDIIQLPLLDMYMVYCDFLMNGKVLTLEMEQKAKKVLALGKKQGSEGIVSMILRLYLLILTPHNKHKAKEISASYRREKSHDKDYQLLREIIELTP